MNEGLRSRIKKSKEFLKKHLNIGETTAHNPAVDALESITTGIVEAENEAVVEFEKSWRSLADSLSGVKLDGLFILVVTSIIVPLFRHLKVSPIIGFLLTGTIVGPTGLNWVNDIHMIDVLGELGIVFFLFEMGLELSMERLQKMKRDVFGLGTSQLLLTAAFATGISMLCGQSTAAAVTIGGSLALSSSAFVLQLLKDKNAMGTRHGKASFGILLLQDLAVVPLIVIVELLSKGGAGLGKALTIAGIKAMLALQMMSYFGRKFLDPIFYAVAKSSSQEAFLSIILSTVLMMSFFTKGIGLSDTLGAFLAGLLLAETKYRHQIEAEIAPFRGLLLGVFFMTVGFSIDLNILVSEFPAIVVMLFSLLASKTLIVTGLCSLFGLPIGSAAQCGLLTSQGGEFAFVALGIAQRAGLIPAKLSKMLLTTVALSMAATPALAELGLVVSNRFESSTNYAHLGQDSHTEAVKSEMKSDNFVVVCGYGRIGKMVCDMLDRKFVRYIAIDNSPQRAMEAKNKGMSVFFGDVTRPEVLKGFEVGEAEACVIAIDDISITNRAVMAIRKYYPELPIIARAKNTQHQRYLVSNFGKHTVH
jgi:monovalent cation:H+ antiporter-2, CPA2 family